MATSPKISRNFRALSLYELVQTNENLSILASPDNHWLHCWIYLSRDPLGYDRLRMDCGLRHSLVPRKLLWLIRIQRSRSPAKLAENTLALFRFGLSDAYRALLPNAIGTSLTSFGATNKKWRHTGAASASNSHPNRKGSYERDTLEAQGKEVGPSQ